MKSYSFFFALLFGAVISFFSSCEKENHYCPETYIKQPDWRDDMVGIYECKRVCVLISNSSQGTEMDTTNIAYFFMDVDYGDADNTVLIDFEEIPLDSNGVSDPSYMPPPYFTYDLKLESDSLEWVKRSGDIRNMIECITHGVKRSE